jgi:hypothetical protein
MGDATIKNNRMGRKKGCRYLIVGGASVAVTDAATQLGVEGSGPTSFRRPNGFDLTLDWTIRFFAWHPRHLVAHLLNLRKLEGCYTLRYIVGLPHAARVALLLVLLCQSKWSRVFCTAIHRFSQGLRENSIDDVYRQDYLHARLNREA